tara:strand:+ start:283 stop:477 length:195 start_codon:yes stop_codon:yes gene_type:complete
MKKSKEPTLEDFLTDIEGLLKDFKKIQEGKEIDENFIEEMDKRNIKFNKKYKDFLPEDNLDSKK